jgi:hypothetical protein
MNDDTPANKDHDSAADESGAAPLQAFPEAPEATDASLPPIPPPPAAAVEPPPSWRPADYYAAPRSASKLPRWVPLGCGVVAILAIIFMVGVGAFLRSGGLAKIIAISFGQIASEAGRMFESDVDAASREAFRDSLLTVRDAIAEGKMELAGALPVLQEMQKATSDGRLSPAEVEDLTEMFEKSLEAAPSAPAPDDPPVVNL